MVNVMLNKKSTANLETAKFCLEKKDRNFYSVGASRAYYAIFQAAKFFLEKNSFDYELFKKNEPRARRQRDYAHGSIKIALAYFLQSNGFNNQEDLIFIKKMYSIFNRLYNLRLKGDYKEDVINKKDLKQAIKSAELFINELKKYDNQVVNV